MPFIASALAWSRTPKRFQMRGRVHCTDSMTKMYTCSSAARTPNTVARIAIMIEP